jgi:hypothetical protein
MVDRERVRAVQGRVIEAVLRGDGYPDGFDAVRLDTAHDGVLRKRAWAVAGAWPLLARSLGGAYLDRFVEYVRAGRPFQPADGSLLDGRWFAAHLRSHGGLPDLGTVQALSFDLHYGVEDDRVVRRSGPRVRLALLRHPPHLLVGVGWARVRIGKVPLGPRRIR